MQQHITTVGIDSATEGNPTISYAETSTRRPPVISPNPVFAAQRRFEETRGQSLGVAKAGTFLYADVLRMEREDHAEVRIAASGIGEMTICLPAHELRRLASDLLDAAFDIEVNPA